MEPMAIRGSCAFRSGNRLARVIRNYQITLLAALGLSIFLIALDASGARAQVGNRNFLQPLIVQDPNPSNDLELVPQWIRFAHGEIYSLPVSLEKQLSDNFSVQVSSFWNDPSLTRKQIAMLEAWAANGAPAGERGDAPPARRWARGWAAFVPTVWRRATVRAGAIASYRSWRCRQWGYCCCWRCRRPMLTLRSQP